jgi:hypothetical protein
LYKVSFIRRLVMSKKSESSRKKRQTRRNTLPPMKERRLSPTKVMMLFQKVRGWGFNVSRAPFYRMCNAAIRDGVSFDTLRKREYWQRQFSK